MKNLDGLYGVVIQAKFFKLLETLFHQYFFKLITNGR